jgi:hypothetical protein
VDGEHWPEALRAYDAAAKLVVKSHWRGQLLDGSALAAQQLGLADVPRRLEAAWACAPTLPRLLRWLTGCVVPGVRAEASRGRTLKVVCGAAPAVRTSFRVQTGTDARVRESWSVRAGLALATDPAPDRSAWSCVSWCMRWWLESVERGEWKSAGGGKRGRILYSRYAKATFRKDRRLNIRLSSKDLEAIQKRALAEGLPYQTLIASLLHKYATGRLKEV